VEDWKRKCSYSRCSLGDARDARLETGAGGRDGVLGTKDLISLVLLMLYVYI